jgi:hypothetical protein
MMNLLPLLYEFQMPPAKLVARCWASIIGILLYDLIVCG